MNNDSIVSSSFRDPSGFFIIKNDLNPQINNSSKEEFNSLIDLGLYQTLGEKNF